MTTIDEVFELYLDIGRGKAKHGMTVDEMWYLYYNMRSELTEEQRDDLELMIQEYHIQTDTIR